MRRNTWQLVILVLLVAAIAAGTLALAAKPNKPCRPPLIACMDVWDPVICDDGKVYSNACYAKLACAKGCKPYPGGPVPVPAE